MFIFTLVAGLSFGHYHDLLLTEPAQYMANAIGVSVGVEETEYSRIARQLEDRATELEAKGQSLAELEQEVIAEIREERRRERFGFLVLSIIATIILILLVINFIQDWRWRRRYRLIGLSGLSNS